MFGTSRGHYPNPPTINFVPVGLGPSDERKTLLGAILDRIAARCRREAEIRHRECARQQRRKDAEMAAAVRAQRLAFRKSEAGQEEHRRHRQVVEERQERQRVRRFVDPSIKFTTLKEAAVAGFRELRPQEFGGAQIELKGHLLARDPLVAVSRTEWKKRGLAVRDGETPHACIGGRVGGKTQWWEVFREDQVTPLAPKVVNAVDEVARAKRREAKARREAATVARLQAEAERQAERRGRREKKIAALYGVPSAALSAACEAMFALNKHNAFERDPDVFDLKSRLIEHLYRAERYTDRVEKLTRRLLGEPCFDCESHEYDENYQDGDCERCGGTGWYREPKEVASYVFEFTVADRRYCWIQPDFAMTFEPRVETTRADVGPRASAEPLALTHARKHGLMCIVRFALSAQVAELRDLL